MPFLKPQCQGFSNFASQFSAMRDNSSLFFLAQTSYTLDKNSPLGWNFGTFEWLGENLPNSSCHIWNHKSVFLLNFASLFNTMGGFLYYFSWNFIWFLEKEPPTKFSGLTGPQLLEGGCWERRGWHFSRRGVAIFT